MQILDRAFSMGTPCLGPASSRTWFEGCWSLCWSRGAGWNSIIPRVHVFVNYLLFMYS
jgi:hypothetical protein